MQDLPAQRRIEELLEENNELKKQLADLKEEIMHAPSLSTLGWPFPPPLRSLDCILVSFADRRARQCQALRRRLQASNGSPVLPDTRSTPFTQAALGSYSGAPTSAGYSMSYNLPTPEPYDGWTSMAPTMPVSMPGADGSSPVSPSAPGIPVADFGAPQGYLPRMPANTPTNMPANVHLNMESAAHPQPYHFPYPGPYGG